MCSCEIELASEELASCLQASSSLPPSITEDMLALEIQDESSSPIPQSSFLSVSVDNTLSHAHSLIQIQCYDHKGLLYDIMRTLKDYNMQVRTVKRQEQASIRKISFMNIILYYSFFPRLSVVC